MKDAATAAIVTGLLTLVVTRIHEHGEHLILPSFTNWLFDSLTSRRICQKRRVRKVKRIDLREARSGRVGYSSLDTILVYALNLVPLLSGLHHEPFAYF